MSNVSDDQPGDGGGSGKGPADQGGAGGGGEPGGQGTPGPFSQQFQHQPVAARVPEKVARGVMATGVLVLDSPNEFVLDFLQSLTRPYQIVSRVILTPAIMEQVTKAISDNLNHYTQMFGPPMEMPKPPQGQRASLAEIYENFKLPEELHSGAYANHIIVGHSPAEFFMDFVTGFYPTASVSARIVTAPPHLPRMVETLNFAIQQYRKRHLKPPQS